MLRDSYAIGYSFETGGIWHSGQQHKAVKVSIADGKAVITAMVDRNGNTIAWWVDNRFITSSAIPESFRKKHIFAFMSSYHKNDMY